MSDILPIRIVFPCLAQCFLGASVSVSERILVQSFIDIISSFEAAIVKSAYTEIEQQVVLFFHLMSALVYCHCLVDLIAGELPPQPHLMLW